MAELGGAELVPEQEVWPWLYKRFIEVLELKKKASHAKAKAKASTSQLTVVD